MDVLRTSRGNENKVLNPSLQRGGVHTRERQTEGIGRIGQAQAEMFQGYTKWSFVILVYCRVPIHAAHKTSGIRQS